ncbi:MAG: peptidyl-dipeptidase Dcp [Glaciecola sp.]|jgi:peptidyl-dipeptidase Dcp
METYSIFTALFAMLFLSCDNTSNTPTQNNNTKSAMIESDNLLLQKWDTPHGIPPFDKIKSKDYQSAFEVAMKRNEQDVDVIINNPDEPTFANTIEALERSGSDLNQLANLFFAVNGANTDDVLKETNKTISPMLAAHGDKITLNADLFARVKSVYDNKKKFKLDKVETFLLDETYKDFIPAG